MAHFFYDLYILTIDCQASPATAATSIPPSKTEMGFKYGWSEFVGLDYASSTEGVQPQGIWGEIVTTAPAYVKEGSAVSISSSSWIWRLSRSGPGH